MIDFRIRPMCMHILTIAFSILRLSFARLFLPETDARMFLLLQRYRSSLFVPLQTRNTALLPQSACSPFAFPSSFCCLCAASRIGEHNNSKNTVPSLRFSHRPWKSPDIGFPDSPTPLSEIVSRASFSSGDFNSTPFSSPSYLHHGKPRLQRGRELSPEQFKTTWPCGMH